MTKLTVEQADRDAADDLHSGWFGVRCEQCRKYAPVMEESDLCQECHDSIATAIRTPSETEQ